MKLLRLLANLGYGSRREMAQALRAGRVHDDQGVPLHPDSDIAHSRIRFDGQPLDPPQGMLLMLHKPGGVTCSHAGPGPLVHDLLPPRFARRRPPVASVGRLDRDTSGLLLLTDDGALLHRLTAPRSHVPKLYEAVLAQDLRGDEAALFASGSLTLKSDETPLAPAQLQVLGPRRARLVLHEGRYHQVRRMFAAVGNHVESLHRVAIGGLQLDGLEPGAWRLLDDADRAQLFAEPPAGTTATGRTMRP
ncbi:MAG TPA: pseudouridine synthase [Rhodanobacteraceae bacterium]|nr:pseudouridine synthase [Rhodanobacteraceae bacterium]